MTPGTRGNRLALLRVAAESAPRRASGAERKVLLRMRRVECVRVCVCVCGFM